jgi:hypothetical protein
MIPEMGSDAGYSFCYYCSTAAVSIIATLLKRNNGSFRSALLAVRSTRAYVPIIIDVPLSRCSTRH